MTPCGPAVRWHLPRGTQGGALSTFPNLGFGIVSLNLLSFVNAGSGACLCRRVDRCYTYTGDCWISDRGLWEKNMRDAEDRVP